ncbi:hypothetical protein ABK040_005794 [Willaertia magna]
MSSTPNTNFPPSTSSSNIHNPSVFVTSSPNLTPNTNSFSQLYNTNSPITTVPSPTTTIKDHTPNILDQNLNRQKKEVSESAFSFLFAEVVQYCQSRVNAAYELEQKLSDMGYPIGQRLLELSVLRDKNSKREIKLTNMLGFIGNTLWKSLYGRPVSTIEKATDSQHRYMIYEKECLETKYISPPKDLTVHCSYFSAGVIKGALTAADFVSNF